MEKVLELSEKIYDMEETMREFEYVIREDVGLHARPAGLLVREASTMSSVVTVECKGIKAEAKKLFGIMGLSAECGDTVRVTVEGKEEERDAERLRSFFEKNF